jgi:hypothetical protein
MDACIVHDNDRIISRKGIHARQETLNEIDKRLGFKRSLKDLGIKQAVKR